MPVTLSLPVTVTGVNCPGSNPRRSVKRQCSSVVSGMGSRSKAASASCLLMWCVPVVEKDAVAVGVAEAGAVAHAGVPHLGHLDAGGLELRPGSRDIGDAERERARR